MVVVNKGPKWYQADDIKKPVPSRKHIHKPTKLRKSISPGSVLILLAGTYRGSRVVFLKQLKSGLLLVTGPYAVNRVPLKRVNQAYIIATSTKVDVSGVNTDKFSDEYFTQIKKKKSVKRDLMEADTETDKKKKAKKEPLSERVEDQKAVDKSIVSAIEHEPLLSSYIKAKFTLKKGQYPHEMKF